MISKKNKMIYLNLSPWPLLSSAQAMNLVSSMIMFLKLKETSMMVMINIMMIIMISLLWWAEVNKFMEWEGMNTFNSEFSLKISMILFILSEILFFGSLFWSYFTAKLSPEENVGQNWIMNEMNFFEWDSAPLLGTMILLTSGITVTIVHDQSYKSDKNLSLFFMVLTVMLGVAFTMVQYTEYKTSFLSMTDAYLGTNVFMITGFHGIHVILGSMFLMFVIFNMFYNKGVKETLLSLDLAAWYWHFVDVIWLFVFYFIYYNI